MRQKRVYELKYRAANSLTLKNAAQAAINENVDNIKYIKLTEQILANQLN